MSELTEEQKRRIEQEERSRLAEEAYREEVRRNLTSSALRPNPSADQYGQTKPGSKLRSILVFVLIFIAVLAVWVVIKSSSATSLKSGPRTAPLLQTWEPVTEQIVTGQFQVPAQSFKSWTITVPPGSRNFQVTGHYSALGGSGNDIAAVVATEEQFQNWINGHESRIFYASPGKVTTGDIDIKGLPPGRYVLAFSNKFSLLTPKAVEAEVSIRYERLR
jgi:hypothetical protein